MTAVLDRPADVGSIQLPVHFQPVGGFPGVQPIAEETVEVLVVRDHRRPELGQVEPAVTPLADRRSIGYS